MSQTECDMEANTPIEQMPGHVFLAKMGKKLLRPGGREATEQMFALARLNPGERVCEIATNRAITAIELSQRYGVEVDGVDASSEFLVIAEQNVSDQGLQDRIRLHLGKGHELLFEDGTFDAVVAEAVITMLPPQQKSETFKEAARVLKPGGRLVFHELAVAGEAGPTLREQLVKAIHHAAWPLVVDDWKSLVKDAGLNTTDVRTGPMSLMSPRGLLRDEGLGGVARLAWNVARTRGARARFKNMAAFFRRHRAILRYIVVRADKPGASVSRTA